MGFSVRGTFLPILPTRKSRVFRGIQEDNVDKYREYVGSGSGSLGRMGRKVHLTESPNKKRGI